jgi:DNA polymerase III epsilon subunit-like protein
MNFVLYFVDTETCGLDPVLTEPVEISIIRSTDNEQKTWWLKPINVANIDPGSLRINGHKIEDLLHQTQEGKDKYKDPNEVLIEIENWVMQDGLPLDNRFLCGQNVNFDKNMLEMLWKKCNSFETFPFGRRSVDTSMIEFFVNMVDDKMLDNYSLNSLTKKYGVKNVKAHSAAADIAATKEIFEKQVENLRKRLKD